MKHCVTPQDLLYNILRQTIQLYKLIIYYLILFYECNHVGTRFWLDRYFVRKARTLAIVFSVVIYFQLQGNFSIII